MSSQDDATAPPPLPIQAVQREMLLTALELRRVSWRLKQLQASITLPPEIDDVFASRKPQLRSVQRAGSKGRDCPSAATPP